MQPQGPYKLVTVNTAPERAYRLVGRLVEALKDEYTILHVTNVERIEDVEPAVQQYKPDILFCASMWTSEQAAEIQTIARKVRPDIATYAIPHGLQVKEGPGAVVEHLQCIVPQVLKVHFGKGGAGRRND
ncbi:hypothetical protein CLAFUW4_10861 [Fulvia fulva]|uniref:Uncharacterized protein n=1 Tax=Passalora fulva TaxID=5499 RepID=A0A9Q8PCC7_PASFU|nr:uncharacterized protein CLAFUR5_09903 [Fulvia fulva]KAK4619393.1 hypothetical protein CLAFUR4_10866 [Fulvia fulva]KAK4620343.1 hypothetical protein CLAFUR0_10873 [Fulvia fulva]UJO19860.1 hypothetical protein CLAFUR5_09903 [Fulvia fulva]WPV16833.1 hypothetical protein CLAFUW4_10861 [Fulvia fulva]WPV32162.1 hypothetical protein CLAFUW7_10859 [Fulvia fulva]